jgi:hypothetical protein
MSPSGDTQIIYYKTTMSTAQQQGNFIDSIGTFLHLPEWNISENIAGGPTTNTSISNPIRYTQLPTTSEPTPTPRVTNPTITTSIPTPQRQTSGGVPPVDMKFYQGWTDQNAINTDWANTWQSKAGSGGGSSTQNLNGEIDAVYNPLDAALNNYMAEMEKQRPVSIEEANNQAAISGNELDRSLTEYAQNRDSAQQGLQGSYDTAYSQAVRDYNALKQGAQTRFGGGSSTGGAVSELMGQEFLRGTGNLRQTLMSGIAQAFTYYNNAAKFVGDKKLELQTALATEVKKVNALYDQKRADIEAQKYQNESAKQAARLDVLREQMANTQNLANAKNAAELELGVWQQQLQKTLATNLAQNAETILTVPGVSGVNFSTLNEGQTSSNTQVPTSTSYSIKSPTLSGTELQGSTFNDLFNVFA